MKVDAQERNVILLGDALEVLRSLHTDLVDTVVTSPPYFLLRNYQADGQLGLEATVDSYVRNLLNVTDELGRVLKPTGSMWLNLGDSYSRHHRYGAAPKSLLLVPERVLLGLAEHGWIVRNVIVWHKPNPMPASVRDRLSCTHERLFLLVRSERYFFDLDAIRVPHVSRRRGLTASRHCAMSNTGTPRPQSSRPKYESSRLRWAGPLAGSNDGLARARAEGRAGHRLGKNPGDVWRVATAGYRGAHFATFPPSLIEPPLRASCPARTCRACGTPWLQQLGEARRPACGCRADWQPGLVLDPFMGAGTTGVVARKLGRDFLGIELNPTYRQLALTRIADSQVRVSPTGDPTSRSR